MQVPPAWNFESAVYTDSTPPLSRRRLNILTCHAAKVIAQSSSDRAELDSMLRPLRTFLIKEAAKSSNSVVERRQYKQGLAVVNEAVLRDLVRKSTLQLDQTDVREYDWLLAAIQIEWKRTKRRFSGAWYEERQTFVRTHGWPEDSESLSPLLGGRRVGQCWPREVAAILLCLRGSLGLHHPQTILEKIAQARKVQEAWNLTASPRKRRGRPPKPRTFSPTAPDSD
jgi:hypothetical protein